ncbi:GntR family transcriptional regulator / MocR family aminotransferase [Reichenbachiella faecimaris]|uniref:GntR family transcriptional regulator / MocR family aminotransferase n=1 Tax=Reichenbachiella faecimaris TaxID=692418 RepID=A0A1W2G5Q2_REIFA|nr:PLP-dependent aminotransferase family protein [Reichenbachiella faecimaris]SMD31995.1 GntR family transcriptional regulator / MocR family aminotransferase [Reichenbachiella faecimaris]
MLPWKSIITINRSDTRPVYLQISDTIISEIMQGRIQKGFKMPGSRSLAIFLKVNRKTILQAYDELMAQGWMEIIPTKGTFIKESLPEIKLRPLGEAASQLPASTPSIATKYDIPRGEHVIDDGTPDYRLAPIDLLLKTARSVSKGAIGKSVLLGNHYFGENTLRKNLASYLSATRAINGNVDNILITRGSQMAIYLAFATLLEKGDRVVVGELNYHSADRAIITAGGDLIKVPVAENGLDLDAVEKAAKSKAIRAMYVTPHHQYPTTVTMPVENRMRLLELAEKYDFYIIEDDYDYDYHYNRSPILPLASIDRNGRIIYIGSFSKILVPSIRIGYMFAHSSIIQSCGQLRMIIDKLGDPIMERALAEMIASNEIDRFLKKAVNTYKARRDLFCLRLKETLADEINFEIPDGGMAVWVAFKNVKIAALIESAHRLKLSLKIDIYEHTEYACRFGFASMSLDEIESNTALLSQAIQSLLVNKSLQS